MNKEIIKREEQKECWHELARIWGKYVTPPARPCQRLLKIWEKIVG